ncbi:hypothetical protein COW46_00690 [Candidatus Gracilibacteria bacterium CG17_big_fil_post_rev_8_21_14_2_50_48_13]|nr:MAG: hypothetical protein COW46_00690 [Candidatus Gracilibacteria bacterium CG17_big_fil_post_rev_8_21_14_2_50_48_13]
MADKYTVQPGDTVAGIAQKVTSDPLVQETLKRTGISNLLPGQEIPVPAPTTGGVTTPPPLEFGAPVAAATPGLGTVTPPAPTDTGRTLAQLPVVGQPPAPTYEKPAMKGGQQTFDLFNRLVSGQVKPEGQTPATVAEQEAFTMYGNYQKYNTADSKTLFDAIQKGEITPDPSNVLWRAISAGGEPTPQMVEAFGWWKMAQERNAAGKRPADPFLGGAFPKPANLDEADALLNDDQKRMSEGDGDTTGAMVNEDPTATSLSGDEYSKYESELRAMLNIAAPAAPEYEKNLLALRGQYGVTALESDLDTLQKEYADMEAITRQRLQYQTDQPVAMNVISGRMTEVQRQQKERLDYLGREIQYRNDMIQTANSAISMIMNAKQMDYGVARQQWEDGVNAAKGLLQEFGAMRQAEMDDANARRDDARAVLTTYYNNLTEGTMSAADMTPSEQIQVAKLELQAGMPVGTFANLRSKNPTMDVRTQVERHDAAGNKYFDIVMQDKRTGKVSIQTIKAGFDAEKAMGLAKDELDMMKTVGDIAYRDVETQLKQDELLYDKPLDRENVRSQIFNRSVDTQKAQYEMATDYNVSGPAANANTSDYFKNYGAITGPNGSPLWKYGLDVDLKKGDPVYAPVTGEVVKVGTNGGFGQQVQIKDAQGNLVWLSHLDGASVQVGQKVSAGAQVGIGGNTGNTIKGKGGDGSHLDITVKRPDGSYFSAPDVQNYISKNYAGEVGRGTSVTKNANAKSATKTETEKMLREEYAGYIKSENIVGPDGKISPNVYNNMRQVWTQQGLDPTAFDDTFGMYANTQHINDYNIGTTAQVVKKNTAYVGATSAADKLAQDAQSAAKKAITSLSGN